VQVSEARAAVDTVIANGPTSFGLMQMAFGAFLFDSVYSKVTPDATFLNSAGCITPPMEGVSVRAHYGRQLRCFLIMCSRSCAFDFK
jgi:hypothetical protein